MTNPPNQSRPTSRPGARRSKKNTSGKPQGKIGYEPYFALQARICKRVMDILNYNRLETSQNKRSPCVILEPQCGKTAAMICIIHDFIKYCKKHRKTFQVIVLCGLAALDLADQTRKRLTQGVKPDGRTLFGAQLDVKARATGLALYPQEFSSEGILVFNNSVRLKDLDLNSCEVDERLIITDEVHVGNGRDGCIDQFLRNHGIYISQQIHTWDNSTTMNHVVGVSATPFAHMICSEQLRLQGEALFQWVYETPPENYNSILKMFEKRRLRQTENIFQATGAPSTFFTQVLTEFNQECSTHGAGYLVIRATGKKAQSLYNYVNRNGRTTDFKEFSCHKKNLDELNAFLSRKPNQPTIVLIRGAFRAGITLGNVNYIRGWVETQSDRCDTQAQAGVGRACGYESRNDDTYPIYCDLDSVWAMIKLYIQLRDDDVKSVPAGIQNKRASPRQRYGIKEVLLYDDAVKIYVTPSRRADREANRAQISTTSKTFANNTAQMLLEGRRDSNSTVGVYVDGPCTREAMDNYFYSHSSTLTRDEAEQMLRERRKSYRDLLRARPDLEGMVAIFDVPVDTIEGQDRNDLQKPRSALRAI